MDKQSVQGPYDAHGAEIAQQDDRGCLEAPFPAKVTPPKGMNILARLRLYRQLEEATAKRLTWIVGPAGAGKTTAVASYLADRKIRTVWYNCDKGEVEPGTVFYYMRESARRVMGPRAASLPVFRPEDRADLQIFSRRFFECLCAELLSDGAEGRPATLVFDNFQDVSLTEDVKAMLAGGQRGLHDGVRAILISREPPPASLARAQAGEQMGQIDFNDLRFTPEETRKLMLLRRVKVTAETLARLQELTRGWAAGITLILAAYSHAEMADGVLLGAHLDAVKDYFSEEVFDRLAPEYKTFLLETALLPTVRVEMANRLTGSLTAQTVLEELCRSYVFTKQLAHDGLEFQYHPLLRKFLLAKALVDYPLEQWNAKRMQAAMLLEEAGQVEDAARLYLEAQDHAALARLIKQCAQELLVQGHQQTLHQWLTAIPDTLENDPWLDYWRGFSYFPEDLRACRRFLQRALEGFLAAGDRRGIYLAWSGLVDSYIFGFDDWRPLDNCIAVFEELQAVDPSFPDRGTELLAVSRLFSAFAMVRIDQTARVEYWAQRMTELLELPAPADIRISAAFSMSVYYLWRGAYEKNAILLEKASAELRMYKLPPFLAIGIKLMMALHLWLTGQYQATCRAVEEGLELSEESGFRVFNSLLWSYKVAAYLVQGDLEQGARALEQQLAALLGPERALDVYFYHVNAAWYALLAGNFRLAREHLQTVGSKAERLGNLYYQALWHLGMAQAEFLLERPAEAVGHMRVARELGNRMDSWSIQWYALGMEAWLMLSQKREAEGLLALHRTLTLGRRHGYLHLEMFLHEPTRMLLTRALVENIEPEFARNVIRIVQLEPPIHSSDSTLALASLLHWPFRVRIYTLGRFEIQLQEAPLSSLGKEKKKPLEMLKALIALGGVEVNEDLLADQLWPEAEGDLAHKSLETTLSRLRRLLGSDSCILYRSRRITLNPVECWVDCLTIEQILMRLESLEMEQAIAQASQVIALCQGSFLGADATVECFVTYREQLREKLMRLLLRLGESTECAKEWHRAVNLYQQAITLDPLNEEPYLRLMCCQRQQQNYSAAVRTFLRCEQNLRAGLEMEPSPETRALYHAVLRSGGIRSLEGPQTSQEEAVSWQVHLESDAPNLQ